MRIAIYGALTGLFVPVLIMAITSLQGGVFKWPYLAVVLWPSSIMLMGTMGQEETTMGVIALVVAVLLNQVLYSLIGALVGYFYYRGE